LQISSEDTEELKQIVDMIQNEGDLKIYFEGEDNVTELIERIEEHDGEEIGFVVHAEDGQGSVDLLNLKDAIEMEHPTVEVEGETDQAEDAYNALKERIESNIIQAQIQANIQTNYDTFAANMENNPVLADKFAHHATGTLSLPAHARGDVALKQDEDALVNEIGQESRIRAGKWELLPPGMHVEHLKRGDIILNAKQTEDLIKHNAAHGVGKIVGGQSAFASGTMHEGMRSFATASASGFFNIMPEGTHDFFQKLADGVDDLNDYNDSARDAGDAARDVGDAADNVGNAFDDLVDQIQYSF